MDEKIHPASSAYRRSLGTKKRDNESEDESKIMGKKNVPITTVVSTAVKLVTDKGVQKALFGVYTDDTPRSLVDCIDGEILSPKDREKYIYKKKKKKGDGKKKNKKKKAKIKL